MKKLIQITALFAAACYFLVGCDSGKSDPTPPAENVSLSVEATPLSVVQGSDVRIIVKASKAVEASLVVNVVSDNAAVTVPATLTIEAGKDQITGTAKGVSAGTAKITITADDVDYSVQSVSITVTEKTVDTPELSFDKEAGNIAPGGTSEFTITSTVAPKADLTINLSSDKPAVATVPASVTLGAGKTSVTVTVSGVAVGDAVILMTAEGASILGTLAVQVAETDKYAKLYATGVLNPPTPADNYYSFVAESNTYGKTYPGCLYAHDYDNAYKQTGIYRSSIDYYGGSVVGAMANGDLFIKPVAEGTVIDASLAWLDYYKTYFRFPNLVIAGDTENSLANGTYFIVVTLPRDGHPGNDWSKAVYLPCWMKIKVEGMKIEVLDGAMCLDKTMAFKVGDK